MQQFFTARLEQLPVLDSSRTDLFARTATQTPIDVRAKRRRRVFEASFRHGAHQV
jgi:hypothetical protein